MKSTITPQIQTERQKTQRFLNIEGMNSLLWNYLIKGTAPTFILQVALTRRLH